MCLGIPGQVAGLDGGSTVVASGATSAQNVVIKDPQSATTATAAMASRYSASQSLASAGATAGSSALAAASPRSRSARSR